MKWIWYELLPSPDGAADDQDRFLKRARRASAELGLSLMMPNCPTWMPVAALMRLHRLPKCSVMGCMLGCVS